MINLNNLRNNKYWILIGILLIFTAICMYKLDLRVVMDEAWNSVPGYTLATQGRLAIPPFIGSPEGYEQVYLAPPLQFILLAGTYKIFGLGIVQGRLLSVIFGLITILLTYLIAQELFDQRVALFSGALVAADNFIFLTSRTVRPEIYVAAFILAAFYFYLRSIRQGSPYFFALSGTMLGLGILFHQNAVLGLIAFMLLFLFEYGPAFIIKRQFWFFTLGVSVILLPFMLILFATLYPDRFNLLPAQYLFGQRVAPLFSLKWILLSLKGEIFERYADFMMFPLRLHIALFSVFGIIYAFVKRNRSYAYLLIVTMTFMVLFVIAVVNKNVRYLVNFLPFVSILTVSAILSVFDRNPNYLINKILPYSVAGVLIVSQLIGNLAFFIQYADSGYNSFMQKINRIIPREASLYGPITYWLGLYQHDYYAYNRVPFKNARDVYPVEVFIVEDKVPRSYVNNVKGMKEYLARHGRMMGEVNNDFYGKVKIYKRSK